MYEGKKRAKTTVKTRETQKSQQKPAHTVSPASPQNGERINVHLRNTGKVTRREADELIAAGKVFVNGMKAAVGMKVLPTDKVEIRGKSKTNRYFIYNKPKGIVSTQPQAGEKDIVSVAKFPREASGQPMKVFPIGRLDKDSTGLIIMTNDGRITSDLLSPDRDNEKEYVVKVNKMLPQSFKSKMENGVTISGDENSNHKIEKYTTKPCKVNLTGEKTFSIVLTEGKNRQIRRMCEALGYAVVELERVRIGKFMLGKLKPGEWREVKM